MLHCALIILFSFGNASTKFSRVVSSVSNFRAQKNHLQRNVDFRQMLLQIPWRFLFTYIVSWLFVAMDTISVNSHFHSTPCLIFGGGGCQPSKRIYALLKCQIQGMSPFHFNCQRATCTLPPSPLIYMRPIRPLPLDGHYPGTCHLGT